MGGLTRTCATFFEVPLELIFRGEAWLGPKGPGDQEEWASVEIKLGDLTGEELDRCVRVDVRLAAGVAGG